METSSLIKILIISSIRYYNIQYNAALAITGAIRGTSKKKLNISNNKIIKNESPAYLYHLIPTPLTSYSTHNSENLPLIKAIHSFFKNTFFPVTIIGWNKLDSNIRCSPFYKVFRKRILEFIRPRPNSIQYF